MVRSGELRSGEINPTINDLLAALFISPFVDLVISSFKFKIMKYFMTLIVFDPPFL